ncbi:MAG: addiction module protein [Sulfurimicrobium sp.]|nr:addiction module protein [Sulfurimicrobium sp.]MDO9190205.1 addiction module protein [Sulfurimicrobium sp.]MDP1704246.1 addiction module protein [Sulfurimicrobium sp.]MDP1896352.1 addiction module protein [Sulfurimicrobium sp.]MDP2198895.1 addiction module protein [Sulfurimicrobium sp.]
MLSITEIIREAECLPVEERALVVDSLLRSLNQPDAGIDNKWAEAARRRSAELRSGQLKGVPSEAVMARLRARFPT